MGQVINSLVISGFLFLLGSCNIREQPKSMIDSVENVQIVPLSKGVDSYSLDKIVNAQCLCEFMEISYKPFGDKPEIMNNFIALMPEFLNECTLKYWVDEPYKFYKLQQEVGKYDNEISFEDVEDFLNKKRECLENIIIQEVQGRK